MHYLLQAVELELRIPENFTDKLEGEGENDEILIGNNKVIFCIYRIFLITTGEIVLLKNFYYYVNLILNLYLSLEIEVWIYGDLVIAVMSTLLLGYYDALVRHLENSLFNSPQQLEEFGSLHLALKELVQAVGDCFSPLILITMSCNVIYMLAVLFNGLEVDISHPHPIVSIDFLFTLIYQLLRLGFSVYLLSLLAEMVLDYSLSYNESYNTNR